MGPSSHPQPHSPAMVSIPLPPRLVVECKMQGSGSNPPPPPQTPTFPFMATPLRPLPSRGLVHAQRVLSKVTRKGISDSLVEIDLQGRVVWTWHLLDHLRPSVCRRTEDSRIPDCFHTNSIYWDLDTDSVYLLPRNVNSFLKLNKTSGQIVWVVGAMGTVPWGESGYHHHGLELIGDGRLLLLVSPSGPPFPWVVVRDLCFAAAGVRYPGRHQFLSPICTACGSCCGRHIAQAETPAGGAHRPNVSGGLNLPAHCQ